MPGARVVTEEVGVDRRRENTFRSAFTSKMAGALGFKRDAFSAPEALTKVAAYDTESAR